MNLEHLGQQALAAMLAQKPVTVTHPPKWERNGFPLPMVRQQPAADGSVTQQYRPIVIFEYIHEQLSGATKAKRRKEQIEAGEPVSDDEDLFGEGSSDEDLFS